MSEYRRPTFPIDLYRDEQGAPIDYGNRWHGCSPPDDSYSRVSNLQRFAPLHAVAIALIEWLQNTFDVTAEQAPSAVTDGHVPEDADYAVRIVPREPKAASLAFVFTQFFGVSLHAGSLHAFHCPSCDACDEDVESVAEELEWIVRTVVSGGYSERCDPWPGRWIEYRLDEPGGASRSGRSRTRELPAERVKFARTALPPAGRWLPWKKLAQDETGAPSSQ